MGAAAPKIELSQPKEVEIVNIKIGLNRAYRSMYEWDKRYYFNRGSRGSAKSRELMTKQVLACLANPKEKVLRLRKVERTLRESCFALCKQVCNDVLGLTPEEVNITKSHMNADFANGSQMIFKGFDNPGIIKSMVGLTRINIDEMDEFSEEDIDDIDGSLRGDEFPTYQQLTGSWNPHRKRAPWLRKKYPKAMETDDTLFEVSSVYDNKFYGEGALKAIEKKAELNPNLKRMILYGEYPEIDDDLVHPNWELVDEVPEGGRVIYGIDRGWNHPTCLVRITFFDREGGYHAHWDELIYESHLEFNDMVEKMKKTIGDYNHEPILYDYASKAEMESLKKAEFNMVSADKAIDAGLNAVNSMKLHVTRRSFNLLEERDEYCFIFNKKTGELTDRPVDYKDHGMNAGRYATLYFVKKSGNPLDQFYA